MYKKQFETYAPAENIVVDNTQERHFIPSIIAGCIYVKRYKVTVEEIEEPAEVIAARLRELYAVQHARPNGYDNCKAIKAYAKKYKITL